MIKTKILKKNLNLNFFKTEKKFNSTNRYQSNFDFQLDWFSKFLGSGNMSVSRGFALLNLGLFIYVNARISKYGQWKSLEGVSYSLHNFKNKDYTPLFLNNLGSRRVDDLILETGILATLGHSLETLYGRPFILKLFFFAYYIGMMSSLFWVNNNLSKRDRFLVDNPRNKEFGTPQEYNYRFMSGHGFAMSLAYFYLFKSKTLRYTILPLLAIDLYIWGPYYSPGALTGIAAGAIL